MATTTPIRSVSKTITPAGTNYMLLDDGISMGKATLDDGVAAVADGLISDAIDALNLGTASQSAATDFATAAQGASADTAVQPGDLGAVATSNDYGDLDNLPTLGTAAAEDATAFATAAQGALADTAFQSANVIDANDFAGASSSNVNSAEATKAYIDSHSAGVLPVADRTALKAVDTGAHTAALLLEGVDKVRGRFGRFMLADYADWSAIADLDTQEGYVIRSTFDSAKVWVRDAPETCPEHFGSIGDNTADDYTAISVGIAVADALGVPFHFYGQYGMGSKLTIPRTALITAERTSQLTKVGSATDAVLIATGNCAGPMRLPRIYGYSGVGLEVTCNLAEVYIPIISNCGTAIKVSAAASALTLDNIIQFGQIGACTQVVEFAMGNSASNIQGTKIKGNFATGATNGVLYSGAYGACDGLVVEVLAMDFTNGGGYVYKNTTGTTIPRPTFKCESWFGGLGFAAGTPTKFFSGNFINGDIDIVGTRNFNQTHMTPGNPLATRWKFRSQNAVTAAYDMATSAAAFNSGDMLFQTEFVVKITTTGSIAADTVQGGFYFYHILADGSYPNWEVMKIAGTQGLVVEQVTDQNATESGRVTIQIRNSTGASIGSGATITMAVRRK